MVCVTRWDENQRTYILHTINAVYLWICGNLILPIKRNKSHFKFIHYCLLNFMMEGNKMVAKYFNYIHLAKEYRCRKKSCVKKIIYIHVYHYLHCCDIKIIRIIKCMCRIIEMITLEGKKEWLFRDAMKVENGVLWCV